MFQFSKILQCQLLWVHWNYLYTLNKSHASGQRPRRIWPYWSLGWKDFSPMRTSGPGSVLRSVSEFHQPQRPVLPSWLHRNNATQPPRSTGAAQGVVPSRLCWGVPASTARVTGAADGKHPDTVGVSCFTTWLCWAQKRNETSREKNRSLMKTTF